MLYAVPASSRPPTYCTIILGDELPLSSEPPWKVAKQGVTQESGRERPIMRPAYCVIDLSRATIRARNIFYIE